MQYAIISMQKRGVFGGTYEDTLEEVADGICNFYYSNRMLWIRR